MSQVACPRPGEEARVREQHSTANTPTPQEAAPEPPLQQLGEHGAHLQEKAFMKSEPTVQGGLGPASSFSACKCQCRRLGCCPRRNMALGDDGEEGALTGPEGGRGAGTHKLVAWVLHLGRRNSCTKTVLNKIIHKLTSNKIQQ